MNGLLGSWNLYAGIPQAVYVNNNTDAAIINLNICNRNHVSILVSVSISVSATSPINSEYIEYEASILVKGVLERTGIVIGPGQYLVVESDITNVSTSCWGVETGESVVSPTVLTQNTGVAPAWGTSATLPDLTSGTTSIIISAS
jgi:hypothetical protein